MSKLPTNVEAVETIDGTWMILVNGFQWGVGPYDRSGCSTQTWDTKAEAVRAYKNAVNGETGIGRPGDHV